MLTTKQKQFMRFLVAKQGTAYFREINKFYVSQKAGRDAVDNLILKGLITLSYGIIRITEKGINESKPEEEIIIDIDKIKK